MAERAEQSAEIGALLCRKAHSTRWQYAATSSPCDECTALVPTVETIAAELVRCEQDRLAATAEVDSSDAYKPEHCPTCRCEPVGSLPADVAVDPYCPEHGNLPTAYSDCSCFRRAQVQRASTDKEAGR